MSPLNQQTSRFGLLAAVVAMLAACQPPAPPSPDSAADEAAIRAAGATWDASYNAGNADAIVALYADDAVLMPPGAAAVQGKDAIRAFLVADIAEAQAGEVTLSIDNPPASAGASGDLGWRSGTFAMTDSAGTPVQMGKWLEVWRRTNGQWLLIRDTWNNDKPPMAVPEAAPGSDGE